MATTVRKLGPEDEALAELGRWTASFATLVGVDVLRALAAFAREASTGAAITLRCEPEGFSAQVTGPVVSDRSRLLTHDAIVELVHALDWCGGIARK